MTELWPPGLILFAGAVLIGVTRGNLRAAVVLAAPLLTLVFVWLAPDGVSFTAKFLKYQLELVESSPLRRLFGATFSLIALASGLYGLRQAKWYELSAGYAYAAGAVGIAFAGDVVSLFLLWQVMVIFSTVLIWCGGTQSARAAGIRYAIMHLIGGLIFKVGIEGVIHHTGSIDIQPFPVTDFYSWMLLAGVLVSAAAAPVSVWLTDAYPRSSPIGSVFLPAFMTTSAVLVLMLLFPGEPALIIFGLIMVFYGIVYGVFESDVRRLLAYALVNQLGFMLCAIGAGTGDALNGAAAVAIAQAVSITLLFMTAATVIRQTGRDRIGDLGGLARTMPFTAICAAVGALAVSALPLAAGFVTLGAVGDAVSRPVYWLLVAGAAGVFLHAGLKYPWFVFFRAETSGETDRRAEDAQSPLDLRAMEAQAEWRPPVKDAPWNMAAAMGLLAAVSLVLGILPQALHAALPGSMGYSPHVPGTTVFYLALLLVAGLMFYLLRPVMSRARSIPFDVDWLWRVPLFSLGAAFIAALGSGAGIGRGIYARRRRALGQWVTRWLGAEGALSRSWTIGTTALWVAALLIGYLAVYYLAL